MKKENKKTYTIKIRCENCGHKFVIEVEKGKETRNLGILIHGVKAGDNFIKCPNCETCEVVKDF